MTTPLAVAVLGTGPLTDRLAAAVGARADLALAAHLPLTQAPPAGAAVVVLLPAVGEDTGEVAPRLLRDGFDVICTAPPEDVAAVREACAAAGRTFHATGGFQSQVAARITRSLAAAARDIRHVELVEELALPGDGVYPWATLGDSGIGGSEDGARAAAAASGGWYAAGLRVLEDGAFGSVTDAAPAATVDVRTVGGAVESVTATYTTGDRATFRTVHTAGDAPLRYRLVTTTAAGRGTATVEFHPTAGIHPADHLTVTAVLDALRPTHESAPGITHHDQAITHLSPDPRL